MSNFIETFLVSGGSAILFMSVMFVIARHFRRYDLVDAAWGWVFIVIAMCSFALQPGVLMQFDIQSLAVLLVAIWGVRLSWHILRRIIATDVEDHRYVELRNKWRGNVAINTYIRIYLVQSILALLILVPVVFINSSPDYDIGVWAVVGVIIWCAGFIVEAVGDTQLRAFTRSNHKSGSLMKTGLWKYSRHPNYFGELTQWWGIFVIALAVPFGWLTIIGPILITYLICFVSGIPLAEKRLSGRSGWYEYKKRTSTLIPLPRRTR